MLAKGSPWLFALNPWVASRNATLLASNPLGAERKLLKPMAFRIKMVFSAVARMDPSHTFQRKA